MLRVGGNHTDDNEFLNLFSIFSSSPSSGNQDFEPRIPTSDLPTRLLLPCITDDNHKWLSEQLFNDLIFFYILLYDTNFSAVLSRDGTCKPLNLISLLNLQNFRPSANYSNLGNTFTSNQSARRNPRRK
jgi:hypothetical protein